MVCDQEDNPQEYASKIKPGVILSIRMFLNFTQNPYPANVGFRSFFFFLSDFPAFNKAIAMACFCGLPSDISVLIFCPTIVSVLPLRNGIFFLPLS